MFFLHSLKEYTLSVHRELEQLILFKKVMTHELTLQEHNPGLPSGLARQYFNAYGKQTKVKWDIFTQLLNNKINNPHEQNIAILSAVSTFISLYNWLKMSI